MYGENSGHLRNHLAVLLSQYRVSHQILRQVTRSRSTLQVEDRQAEVGAQVRRYRYTILSWCHQALMQANPNPRASHDTTAYEPPDRLRVSIARVLARNPEPLPTMADLTTEQDVETLETWRQAAKAATLAELDFDRGLGDGLLNHREWLTLAGDIGDIAKALLVLDRRYQHLPGWETMKGIRGLTKYADDCASLTQDLYRMPNHNIDWRGWHPPAADAPHADLITQVIAAEHRLRDSLTTIPSMTNLRHLLHSQRELSHLAADRARDLAPEQAAHFRHRERAYAALIRASRSAAGLAGTGAEATRHSADAARLLVQIPVGHPINSEALRNLDKVARHVDNRLAAAIEHGFKLRVYLVRSSLPRIDPNDGKLAHQTRVTYEPLRREGRAPLIALTRRHLRTDPAIMAPPGDAAITRADFRAAVNHRQHGSPEVTL